MTRPHCNDMVSIFPAFPGIAMPTIQSMRLPPPTNWQDFETIVRDAQAQRWGSTTLQKNGRPGQAQNGVDIYGPDDIGRPVGLQCKCYKEQLQLQDIAAEVKNAEAFGGQLTALFIATTTDHDAKLQQQVRMLSDCRVAQGKFAVSLLYWDDIIGGLLLNPEVFQAHYPQIHLQRPAASNADRMIAALEVGYRGSDLWESVMLIHGEFGWMANQDPDELTTIIRTLERRTQQLFSPEDSDLILESLAQVREGCLSAKSKKSDWDPVEFHAKRASNRFNKAGSLLPNEEARMLDIGLRLGRIYHEAQDLPSPEIRSRIRSQIKIALGPESAPAIDEVFTAAEAVSEGYRWATRIYTLVSGEIRYKL